MMVRSMTGWRVRVACMAVAAVAGVGVPVCGLAQDMPPASTPPASGPAAGEDDVEEVEDVEVRTVDPRWDASNFAIRDRVINVQTAHVLRSMALELVIEHRANEPLKEAPFEDWLGLDGGALKVGIGLRFGLFDLVDVGVARYSHGPDSFTTWEFDAKARPIAQHWAYLDAALRAGGTWYQQPNAPDAGGWFLQLLLTRTFFRGDRLLLNTGLLFHSDSSSDIKSTADTNWSIAVPAAIEGRILTWLGLNVEVVTPVAGYKQDWPALSTSLKFYTHRHTFMLVFSNTQYLSADGIVAGSRRDFDGFVFGFTITREFDF